MRRALLASVLCVATACAQARSVPGDPTARRVLRVDVTGSAPELAFEPREPPPSRAKSAGRGALSGVISCGMFLGGCGGGEVCATLAAAVLLLCVPIAATTGAFTGVVTAGRAGPAASTAECVAALDRHLDAAALRSGAAQAVRDAVEGLPSDLTALAESGVQVAVTRAGLANPAGDKVAPFVQLAGRLRATGGAGEWVAVRGSAPELRPLSAWTAEDGAPLRAGAAAVLRSAAGRLVEELAAAAEAATVEAQSRPLTDG